MHRNNQPFVDSEGGIHYCERCEYAPAVEEICYYDPRWKSREAGMAWDSVCASCAQKARAKGKVID